MKNMKDIEQYREEIADARKKHTGNRLQRVMSEATRRFNGLVGFRVRKQMSGSFGK